MNSKQELREVRRKQALERKNLKAQRQRAQDRMEEARKQQDNGEAIRRHNAIVTGMVPRLAGAIDSWVGHRVPLTIRHPAPYFRAITDFETISIDIPEIKDPDMDFVADLRGLAMHEAGHVLKTDPFPIMVDHAMPIDKPWDRHEDRNRTLFIEKVTGCNLGLLHKAWNMLEDQRMESAMVRESINLGRYFNVIVLTHVLQCGVTSRSHLLLHGRKHVDAGVRVAARQAFLAEHGPDLLAEAERCIVDYKRSKDLVEMWYLVIDFARLLPQVQGEDDPGTDSIDGHDDPQPGTEEGGEKTEDSAEPAEYGDPCENGSPSDSGQTSGDGGSDSEDKDGQGESKDPNPGGGGAGTTSGAPAWDEEAVRDAIEKAKEARNNDKQLEHDIKAYNHALSDNAKGLPMRRIPTPADPDPEARSKALRLNRAIRNLMEQARAQKAPTWQIQQRRGMLDVRAYVTRQPGDMEFYKDYVEGGDLKLPNMAVSVVLDGSGSMDSHAQDLAIAAFGMKSACDVVGIPCTITVHDTNAYLLWDEHDRPLEVPYNIVPGGGTDPKRALDLLDLQKDGKDNHLVILMTDGMWAWSGENSLANYAAPDRDIVMFYYRCDPRHGPRGTETCSLVQRIDDLSELPRFLTRYIVRAM